MGRCPPIRLRCLRQSHTCPHFPQTQEGGGLAEGHQGKENWLPLEDKAVVPWSLGPALKATNPVAPENYVRTGPQSPNLRYGANNIPLAHPHML